MNTSEIQEWLVAHVAELLQVSDKELDVHAPLANYGLSSRDALTLSGDLEELLGQRLSPTLAYEYPSIALLARYLGGYKDDQARAERPGYLPPNSSDPVAIVGMACRFPGAKDPESYWQLLRNGVDAISEIPGDRWNKQAFYHPDPHAPGKAISYWGGFLDNIDQFDPFFFGISPAEAEYMDPQQRLLLELSYEALDDAGQVQNDIRGTKTGVFIGISINEYSQTQFDDPALITSHSGTGNALSVAANRISYFFDFRGPSMAIDTACSSSLAAVHLACRSLMYGECNMALAGGVNMILSPAHSIAFTKSGVLAPDGRCKAFDADANGYVRGEGGGMIVLKRLSSALADGDPVYAIIPGTAMAQDGRTNGLMAPNREAQEALLREAYKNADVAPGNVQYVEAHGTGTLLGDSMEAKALGAVIGAGRNNTYCTIGSVKSNIGHLEAAAGIAGLIKVVLAMKHHALPPSIHFNNPNPHIPFNELHLKVQERLESWPDSSHPAVAGISSFGFGGTLVHVVVCEAPHFSEQEISSTTGTSVQLLPLSAKTPESLHVLAKRFRDFLQNNISDTVQAICYTAGLKRSTDDRRIAVVGTTKAELADGIDAFLNGEDHPGVFSGNADLFKESKLAFIFPGQGGQWMGMGRELMKQEPVFLQSIDETDRIVKKNFGWSVKEVLLGSEDVSAFDRIDVIQPVLFAIQVALADLFGSWGVRPDAVVGHSMGEVAAAHIAGILTLEDAVRIICSRSSLMRQLCGKGSMLATELSADQANDLLKDFDNVEVAVINGPLSTVLSGDPGSITAIMDRLNDQKLFCRLVNVDVASHSKQVDLLRGDLLESLKGLLPKSGSIPFYSTVTGDRYPASVLDSEYWMDNLRKPVLFSDTIKNLFAGGVSTFIEIGPHPVLLGSIQQLAQYSNRQVLLLPSLRREEPERQVMLATIARLYTAGSRIKWKNLHPFGAKVVHIPPAPWQRQRYWIETRASGHAHQQQLVNGRRPHPLLGVKMSLANSASSFFWQTEIDPRFLPYLSDHKIDDSIIFPAAAYLEMAMQACKEAGVGVEYEIGEFLLARRMALQEGITRQVQTILSFEKGKGGKLSIYSRQSPGEKWELHGYARILKAEPPLGPYKHHLSENGAFSNAASFYKAMDKRGLNYGPAFRGVEKVWDNESESLGKIRLPDILQYETDDYLVHPALLDACLQSSGAIKGATTLDELYIPAGFKRIRFFAKPGREVWSHSLLHRTEEEGKLLVDIRITDDKGQPVVELQGFQMHRIRLSNVREILNRKIWLYDQHWKVYQGSAIAQLSSAERKQWLIFNDRNGLGSMLASQLEADGHRCYVLPFDHAIHSNEDELRNIIESQLKEIQGSLYGIVYLWGLSSDGLLSEETERAGRMQMPGCNSVLLMVQALAKRFAAMPKLWLVTKGVHVLEDDDAVDVGQSTLWGLGKVISFEFPELRCTRIDLSHNCPDLEACSDLIKELMTDDHEDQVAIRSGNKSVLRLLPFTPSRDENSFAISKDATYLITGGLGALGLVTARWLVDKGARHLVLMGRSEPSSSANLAIEEMRAQGVEVVIELADVSNAMQVEQAFRRIEENMPELRGLVHAAGMLDDGSLLNLDTGRMNSVMAPKVNGTWNLHLATLNKSLDFFVLFSSVVSVLGSPGQGNYAAASSFLDAMAHYRHSLGLPALTINWGPWAEIGLAAEATERLKEQNASTEHLIKVISIEDGLKILELLMGGSRPQVVVLPFDLANLLELYPTAAGMPFFSELGRNTYTTRLYQRPKLRQEYVAPRNELEEKLAELWRQTLHIDKVGIHDSFFELGGDSVLAAQILSLAHKNFGIRIDPQDAFKAFTIEKLSEMLEGEIMNKIGEMSEEEALRLLSKNN